MTELPVLISFALGVAIDASETRCALRRLAARQPMPPTVLNGSAANVGGAGAGADRRLTQEAGRFFYWMDRGEARSRWLRFRLVKGRKHVAQGKVARRHHVHGGA